MTMQAVLHQEGDEVEGAFPGPSVPLQAVGQRELGSAWSGIPTSA